jgi:hypothetical protein
MVMLIEEIEDGDITTIVEGVTFIITIDKIINPAKLLFRSPILISNLPMQNLKRMIFLRHLLQKSNLLQAWRTMLHRLLHFIISQAPFSTIFHVRRGIEPKEKSIICYISICS